MGRRSSILTAYYILFIDIFSFALIFPIFPVLFLHPSFDILPHGIDDAARNFLLGIVLIAFPLAQFFGAPFFGDLADRFGRRKILFWTISGTVIGYSLTALGILFRLYSLILISRLLTGFFAGSLVIAMAVISDLSLSKIEKAKKFSYVAACLGGSWILAMIIGSIFTNSRNLQLLDPSLPLWILAIVSLSSLVVLALFFIETLQKEKNHGLHLFKGVREILHVLEQKQLRVLYLTIFFWLLAFFISIQWIAPISVEKYHVVETQSAWLFLSYGIVWTCASGILNCYLIKRFSLWKMILWCLFFIGLLYFFAAVSDFFLYFSIAYITSSLFAAIAWSNNMSLISFSGNHQNQGKSLGIAQSMASLAQVIAPIFGGLIAGLSIEPLFFVCAFLATVAFLLLLVYVIQRKNKILKNHLY